jgi:LPLT family lysophospholipid transporter-like MFS transporter
MTAFADNAILFTVIAMVFFDPQAPLQAHGTCPRCKPRSRRCRARAVGPFGPTAEAARAADRQPLKAAGAGSFAGVEPVIAYALVGTGAAVYGPAKYGILPELVGRERLVRANGWIEGSTILAIVLGTVVGSRIADRSVRLALIMVIACYAASAIAALALPRLPAAQADAAAGIRTFVGRMRTLFETSTWRFSMLGNSLFWASAAVLRLLLVAWAPVVLLTMSAREVADLTLFLALGIVSALLVPRHDSDRACGARPPLRDGRPILVQPRHHRVARTRRASCDRRLRRHVPRADQRRSRTSPPRSRGRAVALQSLRIPRC